MIKKNLLLVTQGFPYGNLELSFLKIECEYLQRFFNLSILALDNNDDLLYPVDNDVYIERYSVRYGNAKAIDLGTAVSNKITISEIKTAIKDCDFSLKLKRVKYIVGYYSKALDRQRQIERIISERQISLVYTYWCTPETLAAINIKKRKNIKVVSRLHGYDLYNEVDSLKWQPFRDYISKRADMLVFVSEAGKEYFSSRWGGNTIVSYLGTENRDIIVSRSGNVLILVSCANVVPVKRVSLIVDTLAHVGIPVEWHHFGDGYMMDEVQEYAKRKLIGKKNIHYTFEGYVANAELFERYLELKADLFINVSESEGLPVAIQEAFSVGIPAVATDVGGVSEIVYNLKNGILLSKNVAPEEIARAIEYYYCMTKAQKQQWANQARMIWEEKFSARKNAPIFCRKLYDMIE